MDETTDMLNQPVKIGDRVAAAFRSGNQAELRTGTVTGFGHVNTSWPKDGEDTLIVTWEQGYQAQKPTGIWISNKRFVKIG